MGNSAGKVALGCARDTLPSYEQCAMTDRDIAVANVEATLKAKPSTDNCIKQEVYEVSWAVLRGAGVLVYNGPRMLPVTRGYAVLFGVVNGYNPSAGKSIAVFNPVEQRLTWHRDPPLHTPTWSVTSRWWRSKYAERPDSFLPEFVAKKSSTPVDGLSTAWTDELCRVIARNWHIYDNYNILGSDEVGYWIEFV